MSMVVQHNLTAMNSNRMLGITTSAQAKSSEKLSSGFKINRAADDAAGLTISEKMRKQMKGLTRASTNAQDGVSAVQTAEGALTEVHSMLQRMNELAVQASNGTNSQSDREAIQAEIDQLTTEIDRVAETTKFNETYLLKGDTEGSFSDVKINAHDAGLKGSLIDNGDSAEFKLDKELENGDKITIAGTEYTIGNKASKDSTDGYAVYDDIKSSVLQAGDTITYDDGGTEKTATMAAKIAYTGRTFQAGEVFEVIDDAGHKTTYTIGAAAANDGNGNITILAAEAEKRIQGELNAGHQVTMTKFGTGANAKDVNWELVGSLEADEIGADTWSAAATDTVDELVTGTQAANGPLGKTGADVKSVTLGGEKTVITAATPVSSSDIADVMDKLKAGDQIRINGTTGNDGTASGTIITIADKTDVKAGEYTIADALKAINVNEDDIDTVEFAVKSSNKDAIKLLAEKGITNDATADAGATFDFSGAVSVVGVPSSDKAEGSILTADEAYKKIAEALQQASSIGTDDGKEASVANNGNGTFTITKGSTAVIDELSFNLHVGADADMTNKIGVTIESMGAANLGIKGLDVVGKGADGRNVNDGGVAATYAVDAIADAISKVSAQRSALGAVQNRLDHTIANLDNVVENTTAAESRIRDTDMATEMVEYSKNNILAQAGQSMLAQANQSNQGVLSLLG